MQKFLWADSAFPGPPKSRRGTTWIPSRHLWGPIFGAIFCLIRLPSGPSVTSEELPRGAPHKAGKGRRGKEAGSSEGERALSEHDSKGDHRALNGSWNWFSLNQQLIQQKFFGTLHHAHTATLDIGSTSSLTWRSISLRSSAMEQALLATCLHHWYTQVNAVIVRERIYSEQVESLRSTRHKSRAAEDFEEDYYWGHGAWMEERDGNHGQQMEEAVF